MGSGAAGDGSQASTDTAGSKAGAEAQACRLRVQRAAAALDRALLQAKAGMRQGRVNPSALLRRLQAPAEALVAALQEWWALPDQVAAAGLEAARAAATRSCANLRCPNLGLEGGAAAGQGVGCKRCSGCLVSYYCGGWEGLGPAVVFCLEWCALHDAMIVAVGWPLSGARPFVCIMLHCRRCLPGRRLARRPPQGVR